MLDAMERRYYAAMQQGEGWAAVKERLAAARRAGTLEEERAKDGPSLPPELLRGLLQISAQHGMRLSPQIFRELKGLEAMRGGGGDSGRAEDVREWRLREAEIAEQKRLEVLRDMTER